MPCYRKGDRAMRPIYGMDALKYFRSLPTATFPEIVNWLLLQSIVWKCLQNLKFISTHAWDNAHKIWTIPGYANAAFSRKFLIGYCSDGHCEYTCQTEIMLIGVLGGVANPQSSGTEGCRGSGVEPFERTLVSSHRHCIVDFPLRFSEIGYWRFWLLIHQCYRRTDGHTNDMQSQDLTLQYRQYGASRGKTETKYQHRRYYRDCG